MPIISYKCENCGASMTFDEAKGKLVCPFCGTEYSFRPAQREINRDADVARNVMQGNLIEYYYDDGSFERVTDTNHVVLGERGNRALVKVVIPPSVEVIDQNAFEGCTNLKEIILQGGRLKSIGAGALRYTAVKTLDLSSLQSLPTLYGVGFQIEKIILPDSDSIKKIPKNFVYGFKELKEINIPSSVEIIEDYAFNGCVKLEKLRIPTNVKTIGQGAFKNCCILPLQINSTTLSFIGESAFEGCSNLSVLNLYNENLIIEDNAFLSCIGLAEVNIPHQIQQIGSGCFIGCSSIKSLRLPFIDTSKPYYLHPSEVVRECSSLEYLCLDPTIYSVPFGADSIPFHPAGNEKVRKIDFVFHSIDSGLAFYQAKNMKDMKTFVSSYLRCSNAEIVKDLKLQQKTFLKENKRRR